METTVVLFGRQSYWPLTPNIFNWIRPETDYFSLVAHRKLCTERTTYNAVHEFDQCEVVEPR